MATKSRSLALTIRIVAGYTLAAAIILTVSALFLYRGLKQGFVVEDTELLSDQVEQLRELVGKGSLEEARQFVLAAAGVRDLEKYYGRLLDENGHVIVETPGMERVAPLTADFPTPVRIGAEMTSVAYWSGPQEPLALLGSAVVGRPGDLKPWQFQIALDAAHVDEWLSEYRERLYWMVGGGTFVTALLGLFITHRGLKPLRHITARVKDVTAHEMHGALDAAQWPAELADLATEFDEMLGRLRASFDRLAQFSADVAHEFRTPLNNLMGATSLVLSRTRETSEYRAALEGNLEQFERLRQMVESLLFIARAENAEAVLDKRPCAAGVIIREVCDFFSALAEDREIALVCEGSGTIEADEVLLRLAVSNLVSNALRHTPRGGRVEVRMGYQEKGFTVTVADTGPGIPTEFHARLFDRFFRVDPARGGADGGFGLGLAMVKSVMSLHRGEVSLHSAPGQGTTFQLVFPVASEG